MSFRWLLRLRWAAILGQGATIVTVHHGLGIRLPLGPLAAVVAFAAATNLAAHAYAGRAGHGATGSLILVDVLCLAALLYFSGGPYNPFSFLFLVYVALAAVVLPARWTWSIAALGLAALAGLFVDHVPLPIPPGTDAMRMHLVGMWVAEAVAAGFIVYFVTRVISVVSRREAELREARAAAARAERLAAVATLATGAAHELSTPLTTIAVAARELTRKLERQGDADAVEDARLIREQVERCRAVLDQLSIDAGRGRGEVARPVPTAELIDRALDRLADPERVSLSLDPAVAATPVLVPERLGRQVIEGVVRNAVEASMPGETVEISAAADERLVNVIVRDRGAGMAPEVLARVGEPFFSTKGNGRGMGLGLFLARTVLDQLGGEFHIDSRQEAGTTVRLGLPRGAMRPDGKVT